MIFFSQIIIAKSFLIRFREISVLKGEINIVFSYNFHKILHLLFSLKQDLNSLNFYSLNATI